MNMTGQPHQDQVTKYIDAAAALKTEDRPSRGLYGSYSDAVQLQQFEELLERLEAHQRFVVEYTVPRLSNFGPALDTEDERQQPILSPPSKRVVEVSTVIKKSSQFMSIVFLGSLLSWPFTNFPLVNPFLSILGLFACPFFYAMAKRIGD